MNLWLFAGSLAAVLALAGIAKLLRLGSVQRLDTAADAIDQAQALVSGFEGRAAIVSTSGDIAAVAGEDGSIIVIEPMGARFRAERIAGARIVSVTPAPTGTAVTLETSPGALLHLTADPAEAEAFARAIGIPSPLP
jgi:hypothetical protein